MSADELAPDLHGIVDALEAFPGVYPNAAQTRMGPELWQAPFGVDVLGGGWRSLSEIAYAVRENFPDVRLHVRHRMNGDDAGLIFAITGKQTTPDEVTDMLTAEREGWADL